MEKLKPFIIVFCAMCVLCVEKEETMEHMMTCKERKKTLTWKDIYTNDTKTRFKIAEEIITRMQIRKLKIEAGMDSTTPRLPSSDLGC